MIINFPYFTSQAEELPDNPGGAGDKLNKQFIQVCLILAIISTLISLLTIASHLKNYSRPNLQRFVIRVLWMTPVFALSSYISLVSLNAAFYVDALRDMYEAFVIYCFFTLMVNYLGGERALIILLHNREPTAHLWPVYYFKKEIEVGDPYSFLFIKRGILQYVYVKPVITFATLYLKYVDKFDEGNLSLTSGYTYITFIYNISVSISLYCLAIFFQTTKKDLKDYRPLAKFLCVKAIIFFSFWQGLAISILVSTGLISLGPGFSAEHTSVALQDSMICFEMLFAALAQSYAFSISDYKRPNGIIVRLKLYYALRDALGIRDIIIDSKDTYTGAQFNYRTFEPVEGASRSEEGRRNRMLQGLRYSRGGQSKYWVDPNSNSSNNSNESLIPQRRESARESTYISFPSIELSFNDVERDIEAENLYKSCRNFDYGDYNIPTIEPPSYLFPRPRQHAGSRPHSKIAKSQTPVPAGTPVGRPITLTGSIPPQSQPQPQPQPTAQPDTQVQDFNPDRELVGDNPAWGSLPFRGTWGKNRDEEYRRIQNRDYVGPDKEFDPWK